MNLQVLYFGDSKIEKNKKTKFNSDILVFSLS